MIRLAIPEDAPALHAIYAPIGPAARIMPRHRSTPSKDWLVSDAVKALPFLPSIESAYAQGYRRMVIDPRYPRGNALLGFDDVLFLAGSHGHDVAHIVLGFLAFCGRKELEVLERIVAVLGLLQIPNRQGQRVASDLFVRGTRTAPTGTEFSDFELYLRESRVVRWEDELGDLLDTGVLIAAAVKKAAPRNRDVLEFLVRRRNVVKAS